MTDSSEGGDGPPEEPPPYSTPYTRAPRNPWWIAPFLGKVPAVPGHSIQMLGVIALAMLFENYDQAMLTAAAKQIAASFGLAEGELAGLFGRVHLGSLAAFALVPLADRIGRRRLFLWSLVGLSLATMGSGFAPSVDTFIALQMVARAFMVTCAATSVVIVTEEFPAAHRGWGIGILGALGATGYGLGLMLFAAIEWLPYGWRALYMVGVVPLLLLPLFRRRIQETRRFDQHVRERGAVGGIGGWLLPLWHLFVAYPWRTAAVFAIGMLVSAGMTPAFSFAAYFLQTDHGWTPGQYSVMAIVAGTAGIIGHPWAGRVADARGRRFVGFLLMASFPPLTLAFYHGPEWLIPLVWIPFIFSLTGTGTIEKAIATELFPTSFRGTASGWLQLSEAVGRAGGLFLVAWATPEGGSSIPIVSLISFAALAAGLVTLMVPETGRRELEEISSEVD